MRKHEHKNWRLNRTTVECKFKTVKGQDINVLGLNRTTVECKWSISTTSWIWQPSLNRTTVECKSIFPNTLMFIKSAFK